MSTRLPFPPRSPRGPDRGDRGSVTLEMVILFPAVLLMSFGLIQGALWYHARTVAMAAAEEALDAARAQHGTEAAGQAVARSFLGRAGDNLRDARVVVHRVAATVTVTVTGTSVSVLPGVPGAAVSQTVSGPVERYTPAGGA